MKNIELSKMPPVVSGGDLQRSTI